jgi:hypothetical protein
VREFWGALVKGYMGGSIHEAVWIGYSLEQLQTLQNAGCPRTPLDYPLCVPRKRIAFNENAAKRDARMQKLITAGKQPNQNSSPSHGNYIAYLGGNRDGFARIFSQFGQVIGC